MIIENLKFQGEAKIFPVVHNKISSALGGQNYYVNYGSSRKGSVTVELITKEQVEQLRYILTNGAFTLITDDGESIKCVIEGDFEFSYYKHLDLYDITFNVVEVV